MRHHGNHSITAICGSDNGCEFIQMQYRNRNITLTPDPSPTSGRGETKNKIVRNNYLFTLKILIQRYLTRIIHKLNKMCFSNQIFF